MKLIEQEILQKIQTALGSNILTYYQGEVLMVPQNYLPAVMVFGTTTKISARDTLKDQIESSITVRIVANIMASVKQTGIPVANYMPVSLGTAFQSGETVTGLTSSATATLATKSATKLQLEYVSGTFTNEVVVGGTSGATATATLGQLSSFIENQYQLRQLMEGRNPDTGLYLTNSVVAALRQKSALHGTYYYYDNNVAINYKTIQSGEFFYTMADLTLTAVTDLLSRPAT